VTWTWIREWLLKLEDLNVGPHAMAMISPGDEGLATSGRSGGEISPRLEMIVDAGLLELQGSRFSAGGYLLFQRLSWQGQRSETGNVIASHKTGKWTSDVFSRP
jgi:hypothetical protein